MDAIEDVISRLEKQREAIDRALAALRDIGRGQGSAPKKRGRPKGSVNKKRRGPSAEGRKRIAEAQRARWAAKKAAEARKSARRKAA